MTALDRLISLAGIRGTLDLRCQLGGAWRLDHPPLAAGRAGFHILLQGECVLEMPGAPDMRVAAGQFLLLPRGDAHVLRQGEGRPGRPSQGTLGALPLVRIGKGATPTDMLCGSFHHEPGAALMAALPDAVRVDFPQDDGPDPLGALVALLRREADSDLPGARSVIDGLSTALFALVVREHLARGAELAGALALLTDRRLGRAWQAMLDDLSHPWTVEDLAEQAAMSRASFMRAFGQLAGDSPGAVLTRLRMQRARVLLRDSALGLDAIGLEVGYASQAAFSRAFKQAYGQAPGQYRRQDVA
ncbi:AraC family transcriptional regulator [Bordetella genomosp. 13]|uniref:AraC family transcriptional regulator n=1 Tax=Bordetella genomosp. 13 TaxID=463040 RepID=UPI0011A8DBDB|nr:AraC family transcriptional regulator [Bordetella genomosp. 13]